MSPLPDTDPLESDLFATPPMNDRSLRQADLPEVTTRHSKGAGARISYRPALTSP